MIYREPEEITKEETGRELLGTPAQASAALFRAALWLDDPEWLETLLLKSLKDSREDVRDAALLSLGHIVRLQKFVSEASVEAIVQAIQPFLSDPKLSERAEGALDDIEVFRPGSDYAKD